MQTLEQHTTKEQLLHALYAWIRRRPGLEYGNYGDLVSYRQELRSIQQDLQDARTLLRAIELSGITGEQLLKAFRAYSGRMQWKGDHLEYTTGQYWPTEYRRCVAAIAASALWDYVRNHCMPQPVMMHNTETGEVVDRYDGLRAGDWLRRYFRRQYGRGIANRWFN